MKNEEQLREKERKGCDIILKDAMKNITQHTYRVVIANLNKDPN